MKNSITTKQKKEVFNYSVNSKFRIAVLLLLLFFSLNEIVNAQAPNWQWAKQMAGTHSSGQGIFVDGSGNIYSTGNFYGIVDFDPGTATYTLGGTGADDGYISKLDASGNFVWAKAFNGPGGMLGIDIATDALGNVYSTGVFNGTSDFDPGIATYNLSATGSQDIYISKLDNAGNFTWAKVLNGTGTNYNWVNTLALDPTTGDVYTTGWFQETVDFDPGAGVFNLTSNGINDIYISKLDSSGNFLWAITMGSVVESRGLSIVIDNAGNTYSVGGFDGTIDFDPGSGIYNLTAIDSADTYILKLDASGNFLSALTIGGAGFEYIRDVKIDNVNGDIYAAGSFDGTVDFDPGVGTFNLTSNGQWDSFIFKLNGSGNFEWAKSIGGINNEALSSLALDLLPASKGVYVTGSFNGTVDFDPGTNIYDLTSAGNDDNYVLKLDVNSGDLIWATRFGGTNVDIGFSITLDNNGYPYLTGYFYSPTLSFVTTTGTTTFSNPGGNADAFVAKLDTMLTSGIENLESTNGISVYPNPTNDVLVISYPKLIGKDVTVTISDIAGKVIPITFETTVINSEKTELNISSLSDGVYIVRVQADDFNSTQKVIVVR